MLLGERTVRVEVAPDGHLLVDDHSVAVESVPRADGSWAIRVGGASHEVHVLSAEPLRLWVDGHEVRAAVTDLRTLAARNAGGKPAASRHELRAPMPGLVKAVHVSEGQDVEQGAALVTLEAMKMENELRAPAAGRVTRVAAVAGAKVEGGAILVVVLP